MFVIEMVIAVIGVLATVGFLGLIAMMMWFDRPLLSKRERKSLAVKYGKR